MSADGVSMSRISVAIGALVVLLALPGMAMGQGDNAALDQYVENPPQPTGNTPGGETSKGGGDTPAGRGGGGSPSGSVSTFGAPGSGQGAAGAVAPTTPETPANDSKGSGDDLDSADGGSGLKDGGSGSKGRGSGTQDGGLGAKELLAGHDSGAGGVLTGLATGLGGDGMGVLLPLILAATLLVAVAAMVARRRGRAGQSE